METILSKYLLYKIPGILHCRLCDNIADNVQAMTIHLFNVHGISRRSNPNEWLNYFSIFGIPTCACGCNKPVQMHRRRLYYNLFADGCKTSSKYKNPACPELHLFRGRSIDDTIAAVRRVQGGRKVAGDRKQVLRDVNSGQNNPMSLTSLVKRTGLKSDAVKLFLKANATYGFRGRKHKPESLVKLAAHRAKQCKMVTKPEMAIWGMLYGLGLDFKYQLPIDRYVVDFLCGKTVIEVFGDYWHNREDRMIADNKKIDVLKDLGYDVLVFWESEIWLQPTLVIEKLKTLV